MRAVIQKVLHCSVKVNNEVISSIGNGIFVLVGISRRDTKEDLDYIVKKILNVRLFEDGDKRWSKNVVDKGYDVLVVSQFTLCHKLKGNKLDFHEAMKTEESEEFYNKLINELKLKYEPEKIKNGQFGAHMLIDLCNDGPVTINLTSKSEEGDPTGEEGVKSELQ